MSLNTYIRLYSGQEVSLYSFNGQVYINADELLSCADTTLELFLSTGTNIEKFDLFERMAMHMITKLNSDTAPSFIAHPDYPKVTLVTNVAAHKILSQILAFNLNNWIQNECAGIRETLHNK
jgi:hypothetical protein